MTRVGTIKDLEASWGSGMATLVVEDDDGRVHRLLGDNGPLIRGLDAMFECITPGHGVDVDKLVGQRIAYDVQEFGAWEMLMNVRPEEDIE